MKLTEFTVPFKNTALEYYSLLENVKTKTNVGPDLDHLFKKMQGQLKVADEKNVSSITTADKNKTRLMMQQLRRHETLPQQTLDQMMRHMADLDARLGQEEDDAGYEPRPTEPDNLPDTLTNDKSLATLGQKYDVEFHEVRNLPGMIKSAVRMLGRHLFTTFTTTDVNDVAVVSTFTNSDRDVNNVAGHAAKETNRGTKLNIDFDNIMPGYDADAFLADDGTNTFLVVQDMAGKYVYTWPSDTNKQIEWDEDWKNKKLELH